jgi:hypothetical protein
LGLEAGCPAEEVNARLREHSQAIARLLMESSRFFRFFRFF